jgi:hypothetical protein
MVVSEALSGFRLAIKSRFAYQFTRALRSDAALVIVAQSAGWVKMDAVPTWVRSAASFSQSTGSVRCSCLNISNPRLPSREPNDLHRARPAEKLWLREDQIAGRDRLYQLMCLSIQAPQGSKAYRDADDATVRLRRLWESFPVLLVDPRATAPHAARRAAMLCQAAIPQALVPWPHETRLSCLL